MSRPVAMTAIGTEGWVLPFVMTAATSALADPGAVSSSTFVQLTAVIGPIARRE